MRGCSANTREAEAMFRSEGSDLVKGSMLALTIDAILDFAGERSGNFRMIECEVSSHDAYGTPRELFVAFFRRDRGDAARILGTDWSPEIEEAWRKLLAEIDGSLSSRTDAARMIRHSRSRKFDPMSAFFLIGS